MSAGRGRYGLGMPRIGLNMRRTARLNLAVAAVAMALLLTGCTAVDSLSAAATAADVTRAPSSSASAPTPAPTSALTADATTALATLTVRGKGPKTGYDRTAVFGAAWRDVDRNGCDTRNDMLARDLDPETKSGPCTVLTGTLHDQYTGKTISFVRGNGTSMAVQIDHRVALLDAWESGAPKLSQERREALANDPINLISVDGPTNSAKGAGDAATWLPPQKSYRCAYVTAQITVKAKYGLSVAPAERDAMMRVLSSCRSTGGALPEVAPAPTTAPVLTPSPTMTTAPSQPAAVSPGSWCSTPGATGTAATGRTYTCGAKGPDSAGKLHWNS